MTEREEKMVGTKEGVCMKDGCNFCIKMLSLSALILYKYSMVKTFRLKTNIQQYLISRFKICNIFIKLTCKWKHFSEIVVKMEAFVFLVVVYQKYKKTIPLHAHCS